MSMSIPIQNKEQRPTWFERDRGAKKQRQQHDEDGTMMRGGMAAAVQQPTRYWMAQHFDDLSVHLPRKSVDN